MAAIGKLERVPLRDLWKHEAQGFTSWLAENLELLGEQIGYPLNLVEQEKAAGAFSVDLFAEGPDGETVVIENQLEPTNHDHLGKVLVYLTNLEAKTAVWIAADPRPEHRTVIEWLNENCPVDTAFYLVKVEAFRIGESAAAPLFTVVSAPSEEVRARGQKKQELGERQLKRHRFWEGLLEEAAKVKFGLHENVSPSHDSWIAAGAGRSGMQWSYSVRTHGGAVELYVDRGPDRKEETDAIFTKLKSHKDEIEATFGEHLIWDQVEGRRGVRIKSESKLGGWPDEATWTKLQQDMVDRMMRLEKALAPFVKKLA